MSRGFSYLKVLTLSCEESTFLTSESLDRDLTAPEGLANSVHNLICPGCRRYRQEILFLRDATRQLAESEGPDAGPSLPPDAREQIREALRGE